MDAFEYDGVWWLPTSPDIRVIGTLSFEPHEGANLRTSVPDRLSMSEGLRSELLGVGC